MEVIAGLGAFAVFFIFVYAAISKTTGVMKGVGLFILAIAFAFILFAITNTKQPKDAGYHIEDNKVIYHYRR